MNTTQTKQLIPDDLEMEDLMKEVTGFETTLGIDTDDTFDAPIDLESDKTLYERDPFFNIDYEDEDNER